MGGGTRMLWYPRKAAFRAGRVHTTGWYDANIGNDSVSFGINNIASGSGSVVCSGADNVASGFRSFIGSGENNVASGGWAAAMGRRAKAVGVGAFVFTDSSNADFTVDHNDVFGMRFVSGYWFTGGFAGFGTINPLQRVHVAGDVTVDGGYRIGNTAPLGHYLRGDGTRFVGSALVQTDILNSLGATGTTGTGALVFANNPLFNIIPSFGLDTISNIERGLFNPLWTALGSAHSLFPDADFASSNNSVQVYNNEGNGSVSFVRRAEPSAPNASGMVLAFSHGVDNSSPGFGGFEQVYNTHRNGYLVQRFIARGGGAAWGNNDGAALARDRKSTRLNSSHSAKSRMPSSA